MMKGNNSSSLRVVVSATAEVQEIFAEFSIRGVFSVPWLAPSGNEDKRGKATLTATQP